MNSIPEHRRIQMGRTHSAPWDGARYANPFQGPPPATRKLGTAVFFAFVALLAIVLAAHFIGRAAS